MIDRVYIYIYYSVYIYIYLYLYVIFICIYAYIYIYCQHPQDPAVWFKGKSSQKNANPNVWTL